MYNLRPDDGEDKDITHTHTHSNTHKHIHTQTHTHTYTLTHINTHTHTHKTKHTHTHINTQKHTQTHTHTHIHRDDPKGGWRWWGGVTPPNARSRIGHSCSNSPIFVSELVIIGQKIIQLRFFSFFCTFRLIFLGNLLQFVS